MYDYFDTYGRPERDEPSDVVQRHTQQQADGSHSPEIETLVSPGYELVYYSSGKQYDVLRYEKYAGRERPKVLEIRRFQHREAPPRRGPLWFAPNQTRHLRVFNPVMP